MCKFPFNFSAHIILACLLVAGCSGDSSDGSTGTSTSTDTARPNILLIVLDDLGYNDLGANGNPNTPTPNLDDFARQGIRYTRNYVDSSCTATRVALLTGRSPAENGFRPGHLRLSDDTITIASTLRDAGYHTEHIGKWHVGDSDEKDAPNRVGFNHWFGFLTGANLRGPRPDPGIYQHPTYLNPWLEGDDDPAMQYSGHLTDILTERAIDFIQTHSDDDQPWFLNLWYSAPHGPIQPSAFFKNLHPNTPEGRYYALIDQLDFNIGNLLRGLDEEGLSDNTMVVILSDNGGTNIATDNNSPFYGVKILYLEGGVRTPLLIRWKGKTTPNTVNNDIVSFHPETGVFKPAVSEWLILF
jgi:arylsulfatase A-like enzyme